jgi:hypothetical protein
MIRKLLALSLFAAVCATAAPAHAEYRGYYYYTQYPWQNPWTRSHFYLGASPVGMFVLGETGPRSFLDNGGGFSLFLGARFARFFALEAAWEPTFHNNEVDIFGRPVGTLGLEALTGNLKIYPARGRVQPYFMAGGGAYLLGDNLTAFAEGPGYQIGGGVDFWLSPWASLGLKVQYRGVELFDYDRFNDNTYLSLLSAAADVTGHF